MIRLLGSRQRIALIRELVHVFEGQYHVQSGHPEIGPADLQASTDHHEEVSDLAGIHRLISGIHISSASWPDINF